MGRNPQRIAVNDAKKIPFCLSEMLFTLNALSRQNYTNITEHIQLYSLTLIRKAAMPKKRPIIKLESFGRYSKWERSSSQLPKIIEFTHVIEAIEGNEFGLVLKIEGGKGMKLTYIIKHPPFTDEAGMVEPDFNGEYYVNSNHYEFYIDDCICLPVEDKIGIWEIIVYHAGQKLATQNFEVIFPK